MKDVKQGNITISKEELNDIFCILEYSAFSLIDIRHALISPKDMLKDYLLPCSAFLFTSAGKAEILLGDASYHINHFSLFHSSKDTKLSILPNCNWLEYYLILYKTGETQFNKEELKKLLKRINPYQLHYGFTPQNTFLISELLCKMYEQWHQSTPTNKFYVKSLFYQFTYEVYNELSQTSVLKFDSDIVGMTIHYIEENYASHISIQDICQKIGISYSHFYRLFKKETGSSFQSYLLNLRLEKAKQYILESNYSLREIAKFTGFYDEFHLSSSFKKLTGISPVALRKNLTWDKKYTYMEIPETSIYNVACQVSHDKPNSEGAQFMLKHFKNKTAVIAAMLSLMTLFTACSTPASNPDGRSATDSQSRDTQSAGSQTADDQSKDKSAETTVNAEIKILSTSNGNVEIPLNPQRVITDCGLVGDIVALGVIPAAVEDYGSKDVAYKDLIADTTVLEKWEPEFIMAEKPDLIITLYEDNYEQLSKIAPTVYVPSNDLTEEERLSLIAEALGKAPEEGKNLVTAFYEKAAAYKEKLKAAGLYDKTFSVIRVQGENKIGVRWSNNLGGQILFGALELPQTELALKEIESGVDWGSTLSFETVPEYMGDYILVTQFDNNYELIANNPIWQSVPAVQAGNIMLFSEPYMYQNDIYSWSAQLDLVANALLELVK
jgi:iron complex transport system substrate-binding protein